MFYTARLGEWPQGTVLFALGVYAAESGWLEDLPPVLARWLGWVALADAIANVTLFAHKVSTASRSLGSTAAVCVAPPDGLRASRLSTFAFPALSRACLAAALTFTRQCAPGSALPRSWRRISYMIRDV